MNTSIVFIDDLTSDGERQLYTRMQLRRSLGTDKDLNKEIWDSFEYHQKMDDPEEEDIIKIFQSEQFTKSDNYPTSELFKLEDPENGILMKYLNGNQIPKIDLKNFSDLYLSIDILYPKEDTFIQLKTNVKVLDVQLLGLLKDMKGDYKIQWLIDLISKESIGFNKIYHCELRNSIDDNGYIIVLKIKHDGIFKRILELPMVENSSVDMNTHLLEDLNELCSNKLEMKTKLIKQGKEKELLIAMILKFSELLSINELSKSIMKTNSEQINEILNFNLIDSKRKQPLSKLDLIVKQANEMFSKTVPNFYVPIMQSLQNKINSLKKNEEVSSSNIDCKENYKRNYSSDEKLTDDYLNETPDAKRVKLNKQLGGNAKEVIVMNEGAGEEEEGYETPLSAEDNADAGNLSEETQLSSEEV